MFNKKSELTKVESFALGIAQWSILDLLPEKFKNRNVFFTQVTVSTVPVSKRENEWEIIDGEKYKCIRLKAFFTTLDETISLVKEGGDSKDPFVKTEILFKNIGRETLSWVPFAFDLTVINYNDIYEFPQFVYQSNLTLDERLSWTKDREDWAVTNKRLEARRERFETFVGTIVKKLF